MKFPRLPHLRTAKFAPARDFFTFLSDKFNRFLFQSSAGSDRFRGEQAR